MDGALLIPLSVLASEIDVCMRKSDDYRITAGMKLLEGAAASASGRGRRYYLELLD